MKDYDGEQVADTLHWRNGNKNTNGIWIPKTILNEDHTGVAHVIGNGPSRLKHKLYLLHGQTGGEGGPHSVGQSYGCNQLYQDFNPTFLFCVNPEILSWIAESDYWKENIVYTTRKNLLKYPEKFYLYPHYENMFMGPAALRLACADGHKKIFLIGFDFYISAGYEKQIYPATEKSYVPVVDFSNLQQKLIKQVVTIMKMYDDVEFYHVLGEQVTSPNAMFEEFKWVPNLKTLGLLEYINLAQLGALHNFSK